MDTLSLVELKKVARDLGLHGYSKMKKNELIALLNPRISNERKSKKIKTKPILSLDDDSIHRICEFMDNETLTKFANVDRQIHDICFDLLPKTKYTTKLYAYIAKSVPIIVVLRRGPKTDWQMIRINVDSGDIIYGQWLRRNINIANSAISDDGKYFLTVYNESRKGYKAYAVISRPPYFTAINESLVQRDIYPVNPSTLFSTDVLHKYKFKSFGATIKEEGSKIIQGTTFKIHGSTIQLDDQQFDVAHNLFKEVIAPY